MKLKDKIRSLYGKATSFFLRCVSVLLKNKYSNYCMWFTSEEIISENQVLRHFLPAFVFPKSIIHIVHLFLRHRNVTHP